ncbi:hypothetical protein [Burkholderia sp. 9779_493]|uniref:hypothetical protein n=1 Tax=Burkholderia sp. 9779_493 TaxID=2751184 RepID=UPI0018C38B0F|nr:hypothetical protein [Burkholderia sp. 9779_493]MBG0865518.1 hypothetical protein [Burkholderia sp. 9779_493]
MATNDFLVFGGGSSPNVIDQATYAALAARLSGFQSGTALSAQLNKVWRQSSIMAAVLAQFTANFSGQNAVDDGTTATLLANLQAAINAAGITAPQFDNSTSIATTAWYWNQIAAGVSSAGKVNGVNNPNLLFNGSGEFGTAGWAMAPGPAFSQQVDQTGGIGTFFANTAAMTNAGGYIGSPLAQVGPNVAVTYSVDVANFATAGSLVLTLAAYNASGGFISNVASQTVANGTPLQRYALTGTTPAGTSNVQAYWTYVGISASAFGIVIRRIKIEQGSLPSLYSQEASVAAIGTSALAPARVRLTQNTNFYVNASTGSDSNNGTTSTSAWATLQKAWNTIQSNYDVAGFVATVNVAAGSYAPVAGIGAVVGSISASSVQFVATGAATITNTSGVACFYATGGAQFTYSGPWTLINNNSGASTAQSSGAGSILIQGAGVTHGASAGSHMLANAYGQIQATGNYTVSGSSGSHLNAANAGALGINSGVTVTLSGTPAFSTAFAQANGLSQINAGSVTFSGSATGSRYISQSNSMVNSNSGGASYFPGNAAGSTNTGGIYI